MYNFAAVMPRFADVILPLPLRGSFTYLLPAELMPVAKVGCRVIVPFGSRKFYTAIIVRLHDEQPPYSTKCVMEMLDEMPAVLPLQLDLWRWIAEYYLCSLGEVFKAALPSGLKLESESSVQLCEDWEAAEPLSPSEEKVWRALQTLPGQKLSVLQKETGLKNILPAVRHLLERGALQMREELKRTYKPKMSSYVRLCEAYFSEERLNEALDALHRSPRQQELLTCYLRLSETPEALAALDRRMLTTVPKAALLREADCTTAVLQSLCEKGILEVYLQEVERTDGHALSEQHSMNPLSAAQEKAMKDIKEAWLSHDTCLLHGVTSSGKTEVYIHLMQEAIEQGRQVLFMLPEIVLTAQLTERLRRVFGNRLGVYHSRHPDAERVELYKKMLSDKPYDIVVGVRSSIFLPFQRLGLVIVDEEHETSFKQQDPAPRYHARNVALVLAAKAGAKSLLGSATPSLESYHNVRKGKYGLAVMKTRFAGLQLPDIEVVDVREMRHKKMMTGVFSAPLLSRIRQALEQHKQVILFQNRRGYAPLMECRECGWTPRCQKCDVSLTVHRGFRQMVCHYCGATYGIPSTCPNCGSPELSSRGYGTERIEEHLRSILPEARIARMDLDTTRSRQSYEQILHDFEQGKTDILIGTQMVTKGLDFENVCLVGILSADTMLSLPDFRSHERAFQMMEQVAGRAGRKGTKGHVILQTRDAEDDIVRQVVTHDYEGMFASQMEERKLFRYPPFCQCIFIILKHRDAAIIEQLASDMGLLLRQVFGEERVLGPDMPPVGRVQMLHIRKLLLKMELAAPMTAVRERLRTIQEQLLAQPQYGSAQIYYDIE